VAQHPEVHFGPLNSLSQFDFSPYRSPVQPPLPAEALRRPVRSPSGPERCHAGRSQDSGRSPATARSGVRAEHAKHTPLFSSRTSLLSPSRASLLPALRRLCRTPPPPWELALQRRRRRFAAVAALQGKTTPPAAP
jgi:hypothetical protein